MSNRYMYDENYSLEPNRVELFGQVAIGATGACTLNAANSRGISSITRNSAGKYTVVLGDVYNRLLGCVPTIIFNGVSAAPLFNVVSETVATAATKNIVIQFASAAGVAADLDSGTVLKFMVNLKNSA